MITQTRAPRRAIPRARSGDLTRRLRSLAWPLAITVLVLCSAAIGPAALNEPVAGGTPGRARLDVGWDYLVLGPASNVLDALSLLTMDQHYAVLAALLIVFVLWRVLRRRTPRALATRAGIEAGVALACLLGLVGFYGFGIVGSRPMAALAVDDSAAVVVDFHSHTDHSHDGRDGFDAEDNREWHASAGFHAVYVSDHRTYDGYTEGAAANPDRAGLGTVLLPALEIKFDGKYASALGPPWRYRSAMDDNDLITDSLYAAQAAGAPRPTLVLTIPEKLDNVRPVRGDSIGFVAVEVNDASPRGLEQSRRDRARILRMADSLDLALVASSNNHGWGRTAAAWTVLRIPGWRAMTPQRLSQTIERKLHRDRRAAATVIERRVPHARSGLALAMTAPAITWQMFGGMGAAERIVWLLWTWGIALGVVLLRRRRRAGLAG